MTSWLWSLLRKQVALKSVGFDASTLCQNLATSCRWTAGPWAGVVARDHKSSPKYGALVESGLLHLFAKETGCKRSHRFESCTLRQICITETHKEGSHSGLVRQLGKLVDCKRSQGFKSPTLLQISERCERGLFSFFAKEVNVKAFRGFESHPFLHFLW